ncbi:MAG TPA: RES family NAD+ phosphorylase [Myxococcota bacterium]|nr:RES family NAD+ phosphorylase [Myxococcota bacterium]
MILHRCLAWDRRARGSDAGGALWVPRDYQGDGRHDNPGSYGCLYASEVAVACVVEQLARFRGSVLVPGMLRRRGLPLAIATLALDGRPALVDLDHPVVLRKRRLRPSLVATRQREITQPQALAIHRSGGDGIRWWSTFESLWVNVTLFDRAVRRLRVLEIREAGLDVPAVRAACELLGIAPA